MNGGRHEKRQPGLKIFISHSSRDRWIAQRLATDLQNLGLETFLDEKDLEAGDDLDSIIDTHLQRCDELLVLLSPSSVSSDWVLVEIGAAKALGKRIVPVLLHLGANDIPKPISKNVAIDLNKIEHYYEQVKQRARGIEPRPKKRAAAADKSRLKVGDRVRFVTSRPKDYETPDFYVKWDDEDDRLLGKVATVTEIDESGIFHIDLDAGKGWFAPTWVTDPDGR